METVKDRVMEQQSADDEVLVDAYIHLVARVAKRLWHEAQTAMIPDPNQVYSFQPET